MEQETITGTVTGQITAINDDLIPKMDKMVEENNLAGIKEAWQKLKEAIANIDWDEVKEFLDKNPLPGAGSVCPTRPEDEK